MKRSMSIEPSSHLDGVVDYGELRRETVLQKVLEKIQSSGDELPVQEWDGTQEGLAILRNLKGERNDR